MAKKKLKRNKYGVVVTRIDWDLIRSKHYLDNGVVKTNDALSKEVGFSRETLRGWEDELPFAVSAIKQLTKVYGVTFEELVKEVYE